MQFLAGDISADWLARIICLLSAGTEVESWAKYYMAETCPDTCQPVTLVDIYIWYVQSNSIVLRHILVFWSKSQ
jgi:hypothetical protein